MMTEQKYILLYEKFKNGLCSPEEEEQLMAYKDNFELLDLPWDIQIHGDQHKVKEIIYSGLKQRTTSKASVRPMNINRWMAAAVVAFILFAGVWKMTHKTSRLDAANNITAGANKPILPGSNKAVLKLANGAFIVLSNAKNGVIANVGNTKVRKTREGELEYNPGKTETSVIPNGINTITTPKGGQYQLTLPDGSKVWLNAGSSLSFPTAFSGVTRKVSLKGEAYFEIAKNKAMPFNISVNNMRVEVLGTHFNIMAYDDEPDVKTTLLEGAVKINGGNLNAILKPGEQAAFNKTGKTMDVISVNANDAIAWKNGYFLFKHEDIKSVMRQISRWYDVDVSFGNDIPDDLFEGTIGRFVNVQQVLHMLELTGQVHFQISERRIIVKK